MLFRSNSFIATIIEILLLIVGAIYFSVSGAIIGMGIGFAFLFILNFISIHRKFSKLKIAYRYNNIGFNDFRVLYRFSLPAALASFLVGPVFWIVKAMLVRDTDFSQLGIYEVADQWKIIILFIPGALSQIILPMLSNIHGEGNSVSYKKVLKINMLLNTSICTFVSLIIILFSNIIMKLYGNGFDQPWPLIILAISTIFTSLSQVIGLSIASKGKMWHGFAFNSIWAALIILFSYIFITLGYGAVGLSLAVLISYIIHTIIQFIYIKIMIII